MDLSSDWRITSDKYNFTLEHLTPVTNRVTNEKELKWQIVGHYGNLEQASRSIAIYLARDAVGQDTFTKFKDEYTKAIASINVIVLDSAGFGTLPKGGATSRDA